LSIVIAVHNEIIDRVRLSNEADFVVAIGQTILTTTVPSGTEHEEIEIYRQLAQLRRDHGRLRAA